MALEQRLAVSELRLLLGRARQQQAARVLPLDAALHGSILRDTAPPLPHAPAGQIPGRSVGTAVSHPEVTLQNSAAIRLEINTVMIIFLWLTVGRCNQSETGARELGFT